MGIHQIGPHVENKVENQSTSRSQHDMHPNELNEDRDSKTSLSHNFTNIPVHPKAFIEHSAGEADKENSQDELHDVLPLQSKLQRAHQSSSEGFDESLRPALENFLSADLSQVKVHNNPATHIASHMVNALAYTAGNHIFLGKEVSAMPAIQQKSLLTHEAVHSLQQKSFSPSSIQTDTPIGAPDNKYEKEADNIAGAFTNSGHNDYKSSALQMRSNMRISSLTAPELQRVEKTWGGEWDTTKYQKIVPAKAAGSRGAEIVLEFKPGNAVDAEMIGLIQTSKAVNRGKVSFIGDKTRKAHGIKAADAKEIDSATHETDEGTHIDQAGYNRNPLYAAEGAPVADTNLGDTLPVAGDVTKSNTWGRHGFHFKDAAGKLNEQSAILKDTPAQNNVAKNSSNVFEVTALAIKGKQAGTYYGSVQWGWRTDAAGTHDLIPLKSISQGTPSPSLIKAAEIWNKGKTSKNKDTLDLPIPVPIFSGPFDEIFDIPPRARVERTARVKIIDDSDIIQTLVEVLSGPNTGARGYVNTIGGNPFTNTER
ncbi:MAG: DUF4157 domain-containing protein [Ginsengibacter sp.]